VPGENCAVSSFTICTAVNVRRDEMGGACGPHRGEGKYTKGFAG
jgi:hypothetical protein